MGELRCAGAKVKDHRDARSRDKPGSDTLDRVLLACGQDLPAGASTLISGSGDQEVRRVTLGDESTRIIKSLPLPQRDRLDAEADGLRALARSGRVTVPVCSPPVVVDQRAYLVMDEITPSRLQSDDAWIAFGRSLAEHHGSCAESRYGWHRDNYIGQTPQTNTRCDDWVRFNADHRLGFQLSLAHQRGLLSASDQALLRLVIDRLDTLIPRNPRPSLLHGDLWSGNALPTVIHGRQCIALIDPGVSVGDGWADIAMMRLFGGFPPSCHKAYMDATRDRDQIEQRVLVYQLYHMLNHLNIFGDSYRGSVISIASQLARL